MPRISNPQNFKGENLISKEEIGLASNDVLVVSGNTATDKVIAAQFLPEVQFNNKGTVETLSMLPTIKFIGDCNVRQDPVTKELIIRIGENLNSSTFNTEDGQTNGKVSLTNSATPVTRITNLSGAQTVWKETGDDYATITPAAKIHFDNTTTKFVMTIFANDASNQYVCGPVSGTGTYYDTTSSCILTVSNWKVEEKEAAGATGYEANVSIKVDLDKIVTAEGPVSLSAVCSGTVGAAEFSKDIAYFITDTGIMPQATLVSAKFASAPTLTKIAGINYVSKGKVNYYVNVADLNNPATDQSTGASIKFDNTGNYAADIAKYTQTTYNGIVTKSADLSFSTTDGNVRTDFTLSATAWNINGTDVVATNTLYDETGKAVTAFDAFNLTPAAGITTSRVKLTSTTMANKVAYVTSGAPATEDLMIYHKALQWPSAFITSGYYGNSAYVAPDTAADEKSALFWFSATGTENNCLLTITGSDLTDSKLTVTFGNTVANLKGLSGYDNQGSSSAAGTLVYKFAYNSVPDKATGSTGIFVKVVMAKGCKAKITNITKSTY